MPKKKEVLLSEGGWGEKTPTKGEEGFIALGKGRGWQDRVGKNL